MPSSTGIEQLIVKTMIVAEILDLYLRSKRAQEKIFRANDFFVGKWKCFEWIFKRLTATTIYSAVHNSDSSLFFGLGVFFIVNLEVLELIGLLVRGNNAQPITQRVLLQILLGQILQRAGIIEDDSFESTLR
jgi:hypothetical protein